MTQKLIIRFLLIAIIAYLLGLITPTETERAAERYIEVADRHIQAQQKALNRVPTFEEIQRMVGAKEDGIIGPNTIALWDRALCNQYAIESTEKMAKGEPK